MQIENLKEKIREISDIAATVPEEFRQKCFELLMLHLLGVQNPPPLPPPPLASAPTPTPWGSGPPFTVPRPAYSGAPPMTTLLSAFVKKIGLTQDQFSRVVGYMHGNVVFFCEPATEKSAQAQIEWALLLALKNAITKGSFLVDAEEVRLICQEKGVFDRRNFFPVFKRHSDYFRSEVEQGGRPQLLTSKGLAALGVLLKSLAERVGTIP